MSGSVRNELGKVAFLCGRIVGDESQPTTVWGSFLCYILRIYEDELLLRGLEGVGG